MPSVGLTLGAKAEEPQRIGTTDGSQRLAEDRVMPRLGGLIVVGQQQTIAFVRNRGLNTRKGLNQGAQMSRYSLLTLDLNRETSSEAREKFYVELEKLQWKKINQLTTLWYATWKDDVTDQGVIETTKSDVEKAASASGVSKYDAAVAVCGKPIVWKK